MRKGQTVVGQDVFSLQDGSHVDSVTDLIINESNDAIVALLVDEGGLLASSKIIPVKAVHRFGPSAVMVDDRSVVVAADDEPAIKDLLQRDATLLDRRVLTSDGVDLGHISDMYFEESTGRIHGFQVSGGMLDDALRGPAYLPLAQIDVVGPAAVITTDEAKAHLEEQSGGLQGVIDSASERAGEVSDQVEGAAAEARDRDGTLVGRRAHQDVSDQRGSVIVANGQRIGLEDVQEARDAGVIHSLYHAAGVKRQQTAEDQAKEAADRASESAGDLWDRFTTRLSQLTDEAGRRVDAEQTRRRLSRINDAIGRPVTKVILDRGDEVILDVGDIVTHEAVQRAHENGMLDSMLDSVHRAEPTFEPEQLRAKVRGGATVEAASGGAEVVDELERHRDELEAGAFQDDAGADVERPSPEPGEAGAGAPPPMDIERRLEGSAKISGQRRGGAADGAARGDH